MPPIRRSTGHHENHIWEQNESTIRYLYQTERKTLKQVKEIMEAEHGFPTMPLQTYETKLRDVLGLRKKLKKADWTAIYQHYQNRGGKSTGIYLNGSRIPWEKAWKEIRRSGARSVGRDQDATLPSGVIVRTPSPAGPSTFTPPPVHENQLYSRHLPPSSFPPQKLSLWPLNQILAQNPQNMAQLPQSHQYPDILASTLLDNINVEDTRKLVSVKYDFALSDIPWNTFKDKMLSAGYPTLNIDIGLHEPWPLLHQGTASSLPALEFDVYYFLAKAIYLISNEMGVLWQQRQIFKILINRVPKSVLIGLFQIDLPTIRATWECLVYCAGMFGYRGSFNFLIDVGLQHVGWVVPGGASYLGFAASMGALDLVRSLLQAGARADGAIRMADQSPLVEAVATGNLECVELLLEKCDINRVVENGSTYGIKGTTLTLFVAALGSGGFVTPLRQDHVYQQVSGILNQRKIRVHLDLKNEQQARGVTMLLKGGANVDSRVNMEGTIFGLMHRLLEFYKIKEIPVEWYPTLLEISYYRNAALFHELLPYSSRRMEHVTRSGIWLSAEQGQKDLDEYLMSRPSDSSFDTMGFLELFLAEQFLQPNMSIDTDVIQGLVEYGVDLKRASFPRNINYFLCRLVHMAQYLDDDEFLVILRLFLCSGAVIDEEVLEASVEEKGINTLLVLSQHGADIAKDGGGALSLAAKFNNYKAVSWLLDAGVNINAAVHGHTLQGFQLGSVISLAAIGDSSHYGEWREHWLCSSMSYNMLVYLIECGAELKNNPDDPNSFPFLYCFLYHAEEDRSLLDKMKLFLDQKLKSHDLVGSECLLEVCLCPRLGMNEEEMEQRLAIFELLLEHGVPVVDTRVLPSLIYNYGDRHEITRKLLENVVDIDVYSGRDKPTYTAVQAAALRGDNALVVELVMMGAHINKPAAGLGGRTALQAACDLNPTSTEGKTEKMKLIQFLIERGAEINAPAGPDFGCTALQCAAMGGDMEAALLLLYHGAAVNDLPATGMGGFCALDGAARNGNLDMVKLLLNVGALSHRRGHSGYEGAIDLAKGIGHFALADLIREHAEREMKLYGVNLAMSF
ncbi:hypothetical protein Hte_004629 [Hypoxylon texense]